MAETQQSRPDEGRASQPRQATGWTLLRTELRLLAELAGLVGMAFVQPVLGSFSGSPETFIAYGATSSDIVAFAALVTVVPVLLVWALAALTRIFGEQVRGIVQTVIVAALAALATTYLVRQTSVHVAVRTGAALYAAGLFAYMHRRSEPGRVFLRYASPMPIVVAAAFLFASPVAPLVRPKAPSSDIGSSNTDLTPVVMIVFDELPTLSLLDGDGGIDAELAPNLARLASTSTWYRNHTAPSPLTGISLPVVLTGQLPDDPTSIGASTHTNFPDNLLARLAPRYEINGSEWATDFCPEGACERPTGELGPLATALQGSYSSVDTSALDDLLDQSRSLWWSQVWPLADDFDGGFALGDQDQIGRQRQNTLEFLDRIAQPSGDEPVLDYLHTALPHQPFDILPSGRSYNAPEFPFGGEFMRSWPEGQLGTDLAQAARSQHLLQVQWTDRILGAAIDRLRQLGRWDEALVIVTADHGVSFQPGTSLRDLSAANQVDLAWTPLMVKVPGQTEGVVDDSTVTGLDVLPTVLEVSGVGADTDLPGISLASGAIPADRPRPFVAPGVAGVGTSLGGGIIDLDHDASAALSTGGASVGYPTRPRGDALAVWRHGRHGGLLGETVADLGVCREAGPTAQRTVPEDWDRFRSDTLPAGARLPLWHAGSLSVPLTIDVAAVVDGRVVGWGTSIPREDSSRFGILLAEPLISSGTGAPELYEIVDQAGCRLRPIDG